MWTTLFGIGALDGPAFTQKVVAMGRALGRFVAPEVDVENLHIKDGERHWLLQNLHAQFLRLGRWERRAFITDVVLAALPKAPETWDEIKRNLLPVVRDSGYVVLAPLHIRIRLPQSAAIESPMALRPLAPGLFETLVIDTEQAMMTVTEKQLTDWGVSLADAFEVAHTNLRAVSHDPFEAIAPGVWRAQWTDSYAASRLTLPEVLQRVCAEPLVAVPNRDTLLVADARMPGVWGALATAIEEVAGARYAITTRVFRLEWKTLREADPPARDPAWLRHHHLVVGEKLALYNEEQALRQQLDERDTYGVLSAFETETGALRTGAVWRSDCPDLLPPAHDILFVDVSGAASEDSAPCWEVAWEIAIKTPGMLTPSGALMPRWRPGTFPSQAWLDAHGRRLAE